jgi:hypothetical protein
MNWRIARYYEPETDIWVLADQKQPKHAVRTRRDLTFETRPGPRAEVPVPRGGRIVWLVESGHPIQQALSTTPDIRGGERVFYTDVKEDSGPFDILDYRFIPTEVGPTSFSQ